MPPSTSTSTFNVHTQEGGLQFNYDTFPEFVAILQRHFNNTVDLVTVGLRFNKVRDNTPTF